MFGENRDNLVEHDKFDERALNQALRDVPEFYDAYSKCSDAGKEEVLEDAFFTFFKSRVKVVDGPHANVLRALMETGEWKKLHESTRFDVVASALATAKLAEAIAGDLPKDENQEDQFRQDLRYFLKQADRTITEILEFAEAWGQGGGIGVGGTGPGLVTDLRVVRQAYQQVERSETLRRIAEIAGRMVRVALQNHRTRIDHGADEVHDIVFGDDISKLVPSEIMALGHPALRRDFMVRFAERRLMQYEVKGLEKLGKGPVVLLIDTSGSMSGAKEAWAKGVALGLLRIALEEKREFALVLFSDEQHMTSVTFTGTPDLQTLMRCLEVQYNRGTSFVRPLNEALRLMEGSELEKADIVLITDGIANLTPAFVADFNSRRRERQCRCWTVLIDQGASATLSVAQFSDGVERLSDMADDGAALELVFGI